MALVLDGSISSVDDLRALDSAILETSTCENIDLAKKLRVAEEALHLELSVFLLRAANQNGVTGRGIDLANVVVTAPLRRWHSLRTLAEVYSDAYNSQFNDRYLGKWKHYSKLTRETSDLFFEYGVGVTSAPVARAAKPSATAAGSGGPIGSYLVRTAWRGLLGASGAPSESTAFAAPEGELMAVDAGPAPAGATFFDVYAGESEDALARQNLSPVAAGSVWIMPSGGLIAGPAPSDGQRPESYIRRSRTL